MTQRKLYYKPKIRQVKLVPEEAVLTVCKRATDPGAIGKGANACGGATPLCKVPGS